MADPPGVEDMAVLGSPQLEAIQLELKGAQPSPIGPRSAEGVVDRDEHGRPVSERYLRLGAKGEREEGLYVRFEPGFGLNVHIGHRRGFFDGQSYNGRPSSWRDEDGIAMSIGGWERLCSLVDEWRERERLIDSCSDQQAIRPEAKSDG